MRAVAPQTWRAARLASSWASSLTQATNVIGDLVGGFEVGQRCPAHDQGGRPQIALGVVGAHPEELEQRPPRPTDMGASPASSTLPTVSGA